MRKESPRKEVSRIYYLKYRDEILKRVSRYRDKNRKELRRRDRKKYKDNAEFRQRCKEYQKVYRKANREKLLAYQRIYTKQPWMLKHHNAWKRKWLKTPKGKLKNQRSAYQRRSILGKMVGTHTVEEWDQILNKFGGRCAYCKKKKKLTKDHVIPLSKGGTNYISNLQPLCRPCNSRKKDKLPTPDTREWNLPSLRN